MLFVCIFGNRLCEQRNNRVGYYLNKMSASLARKMGLKYAVAQMALLEQKFEKPKKKQGKWEIKTHSNYSKRKNREEKKQTKIKKSKKKHEYTNARNRNLKKRGTKNICGENKQKGNPVTENQLRKK